MDGCFGFTRPSRGAVIVGREQPRSWPPRRRPEGRGGATIDARTIATCCLELALNICRLASSQLKSSHRTSRMMCYANLHSFIRAQLFPQRRPTLSCPAPCGGMAWPVENLAVVAPRQRDGVVATAAGNHELESQPVVYRQDLIADLVQGLELPVRQALVCVDACGYPSRQRRCWQK